MAFFRAAPHHLREHQILTLMRSSDSRAVKNGIQRAYEDLRSRPNADAGYVRAVRGELSRHLDSQDPLVMPWIYSLIAALGDGQYEPYLRTQLTSHEFDPVNRSWAVASLARVSMDYRRVLSNINEDHSLAYRLAAGMYQGRFRDARTVRLASDADDRLAHIWVALLFSEQLGAVPLELIRDLTESPDAEVSQYALFALHKHPDTGIEAVTIGPQDLTQRQPRVRRWYYQLLAKDPANLDRFGHQLRDWMAEESDSHAREGLAKAFVGVRLPRPWVHELRAWAGSETDPYVLDALMQVEPVSDLARLAARRREPTAALSEPHAHVGAPRRQRPRTVAANDGTSRQIQISNSVVTVVVKKSEVVKVSDQRVTISGSNNTIGSVQGSGSQAAVSQVVGATGQAADQATELKDLLVRIVKLLREQGGNDSKDLAAEELGLLAEDISHDADVQISDVPGETARRGRLVTRLKQAGLLLSGMTTAATETDQLISRAIEIVHLM